MNIQDYFDYFKQYESHILSNPIQFAMDLLSEHVGDDLVKELLILAIASTYNKAKRMRVNVLLQGSPASGKSHLVTLLMKMLPKRKYLDFSRITPHALDYMQDIIGTSNIDGKIIFITEYAGIGKQNYSLRVLLTEGKLRLLTANRKKILELKGFPSIISTTTEINIADPQMMSRLVTVNVDESEELTKKVVSYVVRNNNKIEGIKEKRKAFKYFIAKELKKYYVILEDQACEVLEKFLLSLKKTTYLRRLAVVTRSLVEARALLFQHSREKYDDKTLIATKDDAEYVINLVKDILSIQVYGLSVKHYEVYKKISEILAIQEVMTIKDLYQRIKRYIDISERYFRLLLDDLEKVGMIEVIRETRPYKVRLISYS